jgi:cysteine desulfurase
MNQKVYLDYAATTPLDPRVLEVMLPYFGVNFGNPSSIHTYGQQAEAAIESARETTAQVLNCQPDEIIFTSGGSESDNLALRGVAIAEREARGARHLLVSATEHPAISRTAEELANINGFELELLPVDENGGVSPDVVASRLRFDTAIVSVMYANNEIGTINPIAEIGSICRERGIPFHTDAVQAAAYLPIRVDALNVDLISLGAHKFYGPKGVGALYIRKGMRIRPTQTGGAQERGLRAGTHNVPYIVGMAESLGYAQAEREQRHERLRPMRDRIIGGVLEDIPAARLTGHSSQRLPNHASFVFEGVDGNALLMMLDAQGYACSSGSACKTGNPEPSGVLLALGLPRSWALGSLRVTLGKDTTPQEVGVFLQDLPGIVEKARSLN